MEKKFEQLKSEVEKSLTGASSGEALEALRVQYLGRKGALAELMKGMAALSPEERKTVGMAANEAKIAMELAFEKKVAEVAKAAGAAEAEKEWMDVTQPAVPAVGRGHLHPVTQVQEDLEDLFTSMGFLIADGPEMESDFYNFTALNIPEMHPARDMQDTFYVEADRPQGPKAERKEKTGWLMRTHTSSVQIRGMRKYGVPLRMIAPGRCFRNEATDVRHEHTFHQLEGVVIDRGINMGHMKGVLEAVAKHLYGEKTQIRLRPKFYPFVEPGVNGEVTCFLCAGKGCRLCKKSGWLEVFGAGMIHPNVLKEGGVDAKEYSGFAFGFGLTRLVMLKYGIDDIRHLEAGDMRFLNQF